MTAHLAPQLHTRFPRIKENMRLHLTDIAVRPQTTIQTVQGLGHHHVGLRRSRQRASGKLKVIGRYPHMSLSDARTSAKKLFLAPAASPTELSFKEAVSLFISNCEQRNKSGTVADYTRFLNRYFVPRFSKLEDASTKNVAAVIDTLKATPSEQNHTHSVASRTDVRTRSPMAKWQRPFSASYKRISIPRKERQSDISRVVEIEVPS
jgi:hypothetical protein